jgi:carbon monoxide dehydrogenase subunit G
MAIEIRETFQVTAPVDAVWRFVMDPQQVVTCMPGAQLEEVVDERTFVGSIKVKVGAVTTKHKSRVQFAEVDDETHTVRMVAEGRETGGGTAKGAMSSRLRVLPDGQTELAAEATVDLTGRVMQVGRGMIQGVSHQLFKQFAARAKERLEASPVAAGESPPAPAETGEPEALRIVPIVLRTIWEGIVGFFRRLFGRSG